MAEIENQQGRRPKVRPILFGKATESLAGSASCRISGKRILPDEERPGRQKDEAQKASDAIELPRRNAEQQSAIELSTRAAQRLSVLGEMTTGIAHDFRNILAVIDSGLQLAENNSDDPEAASAFIAGARSGVARGLKLASQLLTFAKQREFQAQAANANELLKDLELFLRYGAGSEVRIVLELSPDIPDCLIDPSQFNAAILNLVINARDAMPKGGEVRINTAPWVVRDNASDAASGPYVRVRVRDNGAGMADEVLRKIFQPFFTTKGERGTGLGVPQVDTFMRQAGGYVRVASGLGRGTTFDLFFPATKLNGARTRRIGAGVTRPVHPVTRVSSDCRQ